jgi:hypothetical protein
MSSVVGATKIRGLVLNRRAKNLAGAATTFRTPANPGDADRSG